MTILLSIVTLYCILLGAWFIRHAKNDPVKSAMHAASCFAVAGLMVWCICNS